MKILFKAILIMLIVGLTQTISAEMKETNLPVVNVDSEVASFSWSPDGKYISYWSKRDISGIYLFDIETKKATYLLKDAFPVWYSNNEIICSQFDIVNIDTLDTSKLIKNSINTQQIYMSPNRRQFVSLIVTSARGELFRSITLITFDSKGQGTSWIIHVNNSKYAVSNIIGWINDNEFVVETIEGLFIIDLRQVPKVKQPNKSNIIYHWQLKKLRKAKPNYTEISYDQIGGAIKGNFISYDGKYVAVSRVVATVHQIHIIDIETKNIVHVIETPGLFDYRNLRWSPIGYSFAYIDYRREASNVLKIIDLSDLE